MTYTVHVRAAAERDLEHACEWYAVEAPEFVERFLGELDHAIARMLSHPLVLRVLGSLVHDRQDESTMTDRLGSTR